METTYYLQRCHINALPAPTIEDLRIKCPYLFTQKGLCAHFELLTDNFPTICLEVTGGPYVCEMSVWLSRANAVLLHMRPEIINTLSDILRASLWQSSCREGVLCLRQRWSHQPHVPQELPTKDKGRHYLVLIFSGFRARLSQKKLFALRRDVAAAQ